jgi:microcystin-dependent protein
MHHHHPLRRLLLASLATLGLLAALPAARAQAVASPTYIPFQGLVTNQTGQLVPDGTYSIIFNLYDTAVGGQPIWSERHTKVGVINGQLNVFLGSIPGNSTPLTSVDFTTVKYLGITVDTDNVATNADPEMVPRQILVPSFHAKKAEVATNATKLNGFDWSSILVGGNNNPTTALIRGNRIESSGITALEIQDGTIAAADLGSGAVTTVKIGDGQVTSAKIADDTITLADIATAAAAQLMPPGGVIAYGGATAPAGWLLCDGSVVSRNTYPALFIALGGTSSPYGLGDGSTTFNLPDYRGMFLRGVASIPSVTITAVDTAASGETVTVTGHPYRRNGVPVRLTGSLPTPLQANTTYFTIVVDANKLAFAATEANAIASTPSKIDITGTTINGAVVQAIDPDSAIRRNPVGNALASGVGSYQSDLLGSHNHTLTIPGTTQGLANAGSSTFSGSNSWTAPGMSSTPTPLSFSGGNETRPQNIYVNYIIKY